MKKYIVCLSALLAIMIFLNVLPATYAIKRTSGVQIPGRVASSEKEDIAGSKKNRLFIATLLRYLLQNPDALPEDDSELAYLLPRELMEVEGSVYGIQFSEQNEDQYPEETLPRETNFPMVVRERINAENAAFDPESSHLSDDYVFFGFDELLSMTNAEDPASVAAAESATETKPTQVSTVAPASDPTPVPTLVVIATPTPTPTPTATPEPVEAAETTEEPTPVYSTEPTGDVTLEPANTSETEVTPVPEGTIDPATTFEPEETPDPEATSESETTPDPELTPDPDATLEPESTLNPDATPNPDSTPNPDGTSDPQMTPNPDATLNPEEGDIPEETIAPEEMEEIIDPEGEKMIVVKKTYPSAWYGKIPTDGLGMPIPILYQGNYRQPLCIRNGSVTTVAKSGCGPTSVSMVIAYLTGDTEQTPYTLFQSAIGHGFYHGNGLGHKALSVLASEHGVYTQWIRNNPGEIISALKAGRPVIAHMGTGIFTNGGHYIVLRGLTEEGLVVVNDPASSYRTGRAYPVDVFVDQARLENCFMVCWVDEMPGSEPEIDWDAPDEEAEAIPIMYIDAFSGNIFEEPFKVTAEGVHEEIPADVPVYVSRLFSVKPLGKISETENATEVENDSDVEDEEQTEVYNEILNDTHAEAIPIEVIYEESEKETRTIEAEEAVFTPAESSEDITEPKTELSENTVGPEDHVIENVPEITVPATEADVTVDEIETVAMQKSGESDKASNESDSDKDDDFVRTTGNHVNLREKPTRDCEVLANIPEFGTELECIGFTYNEAGEEWCSVMYDGMTGYVLSELVETVETVTDSDLVEVHDVPISTDEAADSLELLRPKDDVRWYGAEHMAKVSDNRKVVVTSGTSVCVRNAPNPWTGEVLAIIEDSGTELEYLGTAYNEVTGSKWYKVSLGDVQGYIYGKYIVE